MLPLSIGILTGLAGCGEAPSRTLAFPPPAPEFSETASGEYVGDVSVEYQSGLASKPDWETFHSVQLRGFSVDRELVCVADYGDIQKEENRVRKVRCDRFPSILVLTADESPCENGTGIEYLVHVQNYSGAFVWSKERRGCDKGIPPEVEETPVTPTATPEPTETTEPTSTRTATNATATGTVETTTNDTNSPSTTE
jgi:hypothetical protein